jgi:hypothetical protein
MAPTLDVQLGANPTGAGNVTGATVTLTTANAVAAGAKIVLACVTFGLTSGPTVTFSGGGLTWTSGTNAALRSSSYGIRLGFADAPAGLSAGTVLTATISPTTSTENYLFGASFLGVDATSVGQSTNVSSANSTTITTGSVTPSADCLVVGAYENGSNQTHTPSAPYSEVPTTAGDWGNTFGGVSFGMVYRLDGASGVATNPTATGAASSDFVGATLALQASASGPPPVVAYQPKRMPIGAV